MNRLNLLVLRCRDPERSRAFYEAFGLSFAKHRHGSGPEHYAHEDDRGVLELYPATSPDAGNLTGLGFSAPDLPPLRDALSALGFEPKPIGDNPWGRSFVVRDPDGRRVEVLEKA